VLPTDTPLPGSFSPRAVVDQHHRTVAALQPWALTVNRRCPDGAIQ
jgi:hypothetical protein